MKLEQLGWLLSTNSITGHTFGSPSLTQTHTLQILQHFILELKDALGLVGLLDLEGHEFAGGFVECGVNCA